MTERLHFQALSSDGVTLYDIRAARTAGGVRLSCTCKAGQNGMLCKHRVALAAGDMAKIVEPAAADLDALKALLASSELPQACAILQGLERKLEDMKRGVSSLRKQIAGAMFG